MQPTRWMAVVAAMALTTGLAGTLAGTASANQVSGPAPGPTKAERAVAAADAAVRSGLDTLVNSPEQQYDRRLVTPWVQDLYSVAYERSYRGLPVVGGDAVVLADGEGRVRAVQSASSTVIDVATTPSVTARSAESTSRGELFKTEQVAQSGRLVVKLKDDKPVLAWETVLVGRTRTAPSKLHVFVDARTGKVLDRFDEVVAGSGNSKWNGPNPLTIDTTASGGTYSLRDPNRTGLSCADYSSGTVFSKSSDSWGTGNPTSKETGCTDLMFAAQKQWDMLSQWLGRNGVSGNGRSFPGKVGLGDLNAYWDGSSVTIGHNQANEWIAGVDVVAHEYGHAIDSNTPGGTSGQEAGLGEATGDIFGALTEAFINQPSPYDTPDYLVGEMINLVGSGPIRNMYNPPAVNNDPACYSSSIPGTEVHAAAGPLNHWFYLLAEGTSPGGGKPNSSTCNQSTLTGVGAQNAGKIFYGGMLLKTSSMSYKKYRTATLSSAKSLDTTCNLFNKTKGAWDAISVPAQSADPTCVPSGENSDFSLALNPSSGTVQQGASVTSAVATAISQGTAQQVTLTASGLPAGVSASFSPATVQSGQSSTLTLTASSSAAPGPSTVVVKGQGTSLSHTVDYALTVGGTTPTPGAPNIDVAAVQAHLTQLNTIASQNGGNRRAGSAGYTQSVAYVKGKLQAAGFTVTEQNCSSCTYPSNNLIADWPGGPADQTIMFGSHLDSVSAGPGINDNGSGSATLLENALVLAQKNPTMTKHVRFAWWTDEEQGLNGSEFYVNQLSSTQKSAIKAYYNFDMVGSTNGGYFINNLNSTAAAPLKAYWTSLNLAPEENVEGQGRSDDYSFQQGGIPTSGYAAGASARKTSAQAAKWGGTANAAYDSCYHSSCDTTNNISPTVLDRSADGVAYTIWNQAVGGTTPGPDFSISASPASGSANQGGTTTSTVNTATVSGSAQTVALSVTGAPAGTTATLSPTSVQSGSSSTLSVQVGASTAPGTYTLTVTGTGSVSHTTTYTLTVTGTGPSCTPRQLVSNGGFESGSTPWTATSGVITNQAGQDPHGGSYKAWLVGYGQTHTDSASQSVTVPAGCSSYQLGFYLHIDTDETENTVYDTFTVSVGGQTLETLSNVNAASGYQLKTYDVSRFAGQTVTLKFQGVEDPSLQTSFVVDDVTLQVS